jgi:hypothetical protein
LDVVMLQGTARVIDRRLDSRFSLDDLQLALVPRGPALHPRPMILGRIGSSSALQLLAKDNLWKTIPIPPPPSGASPTAVTGVRLGSSSFIVFQYTHLATKATSYRVAPVPASFL